MDQTAFSTDIGLFGIERTRGPIEYSGIYGKDYSE